MTTETSNLALGDLQSNYQTFSFYQTRDNLCYNLLFYTEKRNLAAMVALRRSDEISFDERRLGGSTKDLPTIFAVNEYCFAIF